MCIDVTVLVLGGLNLQMNISSNIVYSSSSSGYIKYGAIYTPQDGFHYISDKNLEHNGNLVTFSAEAQVTATVFILPTIVFSIDHIGIIIKYSNY